MKYIKILLLTILSVLVLSCSQPARFSPYTSDKYEVKGNVKTIKSDTYYQNSKLLYSEIYTFDEYGRLCSIENISGGSSSMTQIEYKKNGRIGKMTRDGYEKCLVKYDENGDLAKLTFVESEVDGVKYGMFNEYTYDENGNITVEKAGYLESDYSLVEKEYVDNVLKQVNISGMESDVKYVCDANGLPVSMTVTDNMEERVTSRGTFKYKYDQTGNWTEKVERENRRLSSTVKRTITYYSAEEIAAVAAAAPAKPEKVAETDNPDKTEEAEEVKKAGASFSIGKFVSDYIDDVKFRGGFSDNSPGRVLFIILLICTLALAVLGCYLASDFLFYNFTGHTLKNGMRRLWMYNYEPYAKVGSMILIALAAFVASILLILLVGGVIWGLLWVIKLLLWALIVVGWLCLIGGGLALLGKEAVGCLPLIVGIVIVGAQDTIEEVGQDLVEWGFEFMQSVNMFNWGLSIFVNYWDVILIIFLAPMVLFLAFAAVVITLNMLLNGLEFIITRIYSIRRPCPSCGSTATPDYIIGGKPHPVKLHPGVYGVFTQRSPVTGKNVPTMLLNGRGKITRKCRNCNSYINADTENTFGTEIHIGIVGHRSSGKSYLLYSGLSALMNAYPGRFSQIDADSETKIETKKRRIDARDGIQTDVSNRYRAVQLMLKSKLRPLPYHLFFYDVAGEKFNVSSSSHKTAMDFYTNVQSIVFIIDPSMIDITGIPASPKFQEWSRQKGNSEKYKIEGSFSVLKDILESVGRKSGKIDFNFVCTKVDMGYLANSGYSQNPTEEEIERFLTFELGLANLVNSAKASFDSVSFYTVSAIETDKSALKNLFVKLLDQRNVSL